MAAIEGSDAGSRVVAATVVIVDGEEEARTTLMARLGWGSGKSDGLHNRRSQQRREQRWQRDKGNRCWRKGRTTVVESCGCGRGLEMAAWGRGRSKVGAGAIEE
ncbi:hypothetical protein BHE74_00020167 [Ensete ventricosum]|nr:hypothetical protein GW17_00004264 [Ensete ventricosum]RWW72050.1 hypothetical protein BHE74_00020167 [Ensete ventricosum]